jgi:hypothetical protein
MTAASNNANRVVSANWDRIEVHCLQFAGEDTTLRAWHIFAGLLVALSGRCAHQDFCGLVSIEA